MLSCELKKKVLAKNMDSPSVEVWEWGVSDLSPDSRFEFTPTHLIETSHGKRLLWI